MADIFISYSHDDAKAARRIASTLEHMGWSVWWDASLEVASHFRAEIESELCAAKCIIVLWSSTSTTSPWVRSEASMGLDRNVLVPAIISPCSLPLPFNEIQCANLLAWTGAAKDSDWQAMCSAIERYAGPSLSGDSSLLRARFRNSVFDDLQSPWLKTTVEDELSRIIEAVSIALTKIYQNVAAAAIEDWRACRDGADTIAALPNLAERNFKLALQTTETQALIAGIIFEFALEIAKRLPTFSDGSFDANPNWDLPEEIIEVPGHHGILDASWFADNKALLSTFDTFFDRIADEWMTSLGRTLKVLLAANSQVSRGWLAVPALAALFPKIILAVGAAMLPVAFYKTSPGRAAINAGLFRVALPSEWREAANLDAQKFLDAIKIEPEAIRTKLLERDIYRLGAQLENAVKDIAIHQSNLAALRQQNSTN